MIVTLPSQSLLDRLAPLVDASVELHLWPMDAASGLGHIDLAVMPYMAPASLLSVLAGEDVSAVQSQALGHDNGEQYLPEGVVFCNAVGVHEGSTAELALGLILVAQREFDTYLRESGRWNQVFSPGLMGLTVLLVGVGGVLRSQFDHEDARDHQDDADAHHGGEPFIEQDGGQHRGGRDAQRAPDAVGNTEGHTALQHEGEEGEG